MIPSRPQAKIRRAEIRALTGLRGAAAAYVVLFHFTDNGRATEGVVHQVLSHGYLAVDVFFVLSGYVMALTYAEPFSRGLRLDAYGTFLLKRLGRVYPLYLAATLACAALAALDPAMEGPLTGPVLLGNVLMVQSWGLFHSLDYPGWSISTEFAAYLLFPILVAAALGGGLARCRTVALLATGLLMVLATRSATDLQEVGHRLGPLDIWSAATLYPVLRCLCGFTLGLCAWRAGGVPLVRQAAGHAGAGLALCLAGLALLALPGTDVLLVLLSTALVAALAAGQSLPARALAAAPAYWLGTVSYSLYLVHYPVRWAFGPAVRAVLDRLGAPKPGALASVLLIGISLALAALAYAWIERPGRDLSRLVAGRLRFRSVPKVTHEA
jgi:peptidoglycan/LPS O-acetylase OafA/YrhL